jgi:very-short-patch-repair endonuclease
MNVFEACRLYGTVNFKRNRFFKKQRCKMEKYARRVVSAGLEETPKVVVGYAHQHYHNPTRAEREFRRMLKAIRMSSYFRSQYPAYGYIMDFFSPELLLGIELDGLSHIEKKEYDQERTRVLFSHGIKLIRFANWQVFSQKDKVLTETIKAVGDFKKLKRLRNRKYTKRLYGRAGRGEVIPHGPVKVFMASEYSQGQLKQLVPSEMARA